MADAVEDCIDSFQRTQVQQPMDGAFGILTPSRLTHLVPMDEFILFMEAEGVATSFLVQLAKFGKDYTHDLDSDYDYISRKECSDKVTLKRNRDDESPVKKQEKLAKLDDARKKRSEEFGIGKVTQQEKLVSVFYSIEHVLI